MKSMIIFSSLVLALLISIGVQSGFQIYSITHYQDWLFDFTLLAGITLPILFLVGFSVWNKLNN